MKIKRFEASERDGKPALIVVCEIDGVEYEWADIIEDTSYFAAHGAVIGQAFDRTLKRIAKP